MRINDIIKEKFEYKVDKSKAEIFELIAIAKQNKAWTGFLTETFDYKEINIVNGIIEINRKPTTFDPFRPLGTIILKIDELGECKSNLKGEMVPYSGKLTITLAFIYGFLILFTFGVLFTIDFPNSLFMIILAWLGFTAFLYLQYRYFRSELRRYYIEFIKELNKIGN